MISKRPKKNRIIVPISVLGHSAELINIDNNNNKLSKMDDNSKKDKLDSPTNIALDSILHVIYSELLVWFGIITSIFVSIFVLSTIIDRKTIGSIFIKTITNNTTVFCGNFNGEFFTFHILAILVTAIVLIFVSMILINGKPRNDKKGKNNQMILFMFLSTSILCIYILLTGGFLDSPFSSTLSIYLAGFLLMQDRKDTNLYNKSIIVFASILVVIPYLLLSYYNSNDLTYFFEYKKHDYIANYRLFLSYGLAIFSIYRGYRINRKINKLYE